MRLVKTNLLICPSCENQGFREILGEVDSTGAVLVQRFHRGYTKIIGNEFSIECGRCNEKIFLKRGGENESGYERIVWIHRITFSQGSVIQGLQRVTDNQGTFIQSGGTTNVFSNGTA